MSRKKRAVPVSGAVWRLSAEEATLAGKPRYNGFACGPGVHGDVKYNRAKAKRAWDRKEPLGAPSPFRRRFVG